MRHEYVVTFDFQQLLFCFGPSFGDFLSFLVILKIRKILHFENFGKKPSFGLEFRGQILILEKDDQTKVSSFYP